MSFLKGLFGSGRGHTQGDAYSGLRAQALGLTAGQAGASEASDAVFGVLVDMGLDRGNCATVVALADGTASLYTSSGGGIIGAGDHPAVAAAAQELVAQAEHDRALFVGPWSDSNLSDGEVRIICLAPSGSLAAGGMGDDLIQEAHSLFAVFVAANELLHRINVADAAAGRG